MVVADTSYLVSLSEKRPPFVDFHTKAVNVGTLFCINISIRTEFIKSVRKEQLIKAILSLVAKDRVIELRYRALLTMPKAAFTPASLSKNDAYNKIYKNHVRQGDLKVLLANLEGNIWKTAERFEKDGGLNYLEDANRTGQSGSFADILSRNFWDGLGELMEETCLNSSDAMIANFAFSIGAEAIVTTDTDFAQLSDLIEVYMPGEKADLCKAYDPVED